MANVLYDKGREHFGNGDIDWVDDDIIAVLVDMDEYPAFDITSDEKLSDIPADARVAGGTLGTKVSLTGNSNVAGVMDATNTTFPLVSGDKCEAVVLCKRDTGTFEDSLLIAYINDAVGLPVTPGGGDITIQWADTDNKIFKL